VLGRGSRNLQEGTHRISTSRDGYKENGPEKYSGAAVFRAGFGEELQDWSLEEGKESDWQARLVGVGSGSGRGQAEFRSGLERDGGERRPPI